MAKAQRPPNKVETTPSGITIEFWDSVGLDGEAQQRRYRVNGERFVNVTTVVNLLAKEALLGWVERLTLEGLNWRDERDAAADRGQATHDIVLKILLGKRASLRNLDADHRAWGQGALTWLRDRSPKVEAAETMVAAPSHGIAGRIDLLGEIQVVRTLADFKTVTEWKDDPKGNRYPPYNENLLQLDLYQQGLIESGYEPAQRGLIVRLGPDGTYDETPVELDPERGLAVLGAYRANLAAGREIRAAFKAERTRIETEGQIAEAVAS